MATAFSMAFFLGLIGSLHCVGMCGPLVLGLPVIGGENVVRLYSMLRYHAGRITTYSLGGFVFGLLGRRIWLAGWQQGFSIALGIFLLLHLVLRGRLPSWALRPYLRLQGWMSRAWSSPGRAAFFAMGMANGLLPCGMVYMAVAGALTRPNILEAVGFMACFGVGTLPLLLCLQWSGFLLRPVYRWRLRRVLPLFTILVALLLILRGLDLGIPFISPVLPASPGHAVSCG